MIPTTEFRSEHLFHTVFDLRAAHRQLLRQQKEVPVETIKNVVADFVTRARASGVLLHASEHRDFAQTIIDYWTATLYREQIEIPAATLEAYDPGLQRELTDKEIPYVGLKPFDEERSQWFFGRERLVKTLLGTLEKERFAMVIGQSGTGKSSLVLAGLLPRLRAGAIPGSEGWRYLTPIVPGSEPLVSLARLIKPAADPDSLRAEGRRFLLSAHLRTSLTTPDGRPVVLVVDQFEELFTLCGSDEERKAFASNLALLATSPDIAHRVIITVRSDYETQLVQLDELVTHMRAGEVHVGALNASELREVIEKPAALVGLTFEEGLVDALVEETLGEPAALPLLQFTLTRLWEERDRNHIAFTAYRRLGGALQMLAREADKIYQNLDHGSKAVARRIFLRVIRQGAVQPTSSRVRRSEVLVSETGADAERVLERLVGASLLRYALRDSEEDPYVELAHETLVRNWPRLTQWLDEERAHLQRRDRLEAAAQEWVDRQRSAGLLDEVQLRDAEEWLESAKAKELGTTVAVLDLVRASRKKVDQDAAAERARKYAARFRITALIVLVIASLAFGVLYFYEAAMTARTAEARARLQFDQLLLESTDKQIAELRTRLVEPRDRQVAMLDAELAKSKQEHSDLTVRVADLLVENTTLKAERDALRVSAGVADQLRRELEAVKSERGAAVKDRDEFQTALVRRLAEITQYKREIEELRKAAERGRPSAPPVYPMFPLSGKSDKKDKNDKKNEERLQVGAPVSLAAEDAKRAAICCFLKRGPERLLVTALQGNEGKIGDVIVEHGPKGPRRVGVIDYFDDVHGTAVVRLYNGVGKDKKAPIIEGFDGTARARQGSTVRVLTREDAVQSSVESVTRDKILIAARPGGSVVGAAVVDSGEELIGLVTGIENGMLIVQPIGTILDVTDAELDN